MSTAIAWTLINRGTGAGKEYQILVVEDLVVFGWGSLGNVGRQYQVTAAVSPEEARRFAVTQTAAKEARGYVVSRTPTSAPATSAQIDYLRRKIGTKAADPSIKSAIAQILESGTPL